MDIAVNVLSYSDMQLDLKEAENIHYYCNVLFLYLYFLGLSLRNTSKALVILRDGNQRSYVSIYNWIQKRFDSFQIYKRKRVYPFIIDETII